MIKVFRGSIHNDKRGYLWTSWKKNKKNKLIFNHDKFSVSKKKCFKRFTWRQQTWKLISCVYGEIFFVVVNYDKKSKNFW